MAAFDATASCSPDATTWRALGSSYVFAHTGGGGSAGRLRAIQ
jgi:hypothetical protein